MRVVNLIEEENQQQRQSGFVFFHLSDFLWFCHPCKGREREGEDFGRWPLCLMQHQLGREESGGGCGHRRIEGSNVVDP